MKQDIITKALVRGVKTGKLVAKQYGVTLTPEQHKDFVGHYTVKYFVPS